MYFPAFLDIAQQFKSSRPRLGDRFAARLQQVFGVEVPLRHVRGNPTVAGLAEAMEADSATGARVRVAELPAELADPEA